MSRSRVAALRKLLFLSLILAPLVLVPSSDTEGGFHPISGHWVASSSSDICIDFDRVCADWIDDALGQVGSCCVPSEVLGQNAPFACSDFEGWYGLRLAGPS